MPMVKQGPQVFFVIGVNCLFQLGPILGSQGQGQDKRQQQQRSENSHDQSSGGNDRGRYQAAGAGNDGSFIVRLEREPVHNAQPLARLLPLFDIGANIGVGGDCVEIDIAGLPRCLVGQGRDNTRTDLGLSAGQY